MDAFEAVVTSFEERFQVHPVILAMEEYILSTDPTQCINSIDAIVEHGRGMFSKETLVYEMQQYRRYELHQSMSPMTST